MGMLAVVLAAAAVGSRWFFSDAGADSVLFVLDGLFPAVLLGVLTLVAAWWGSRRLEAQDMGWGGLRVALACGVAGVFLHSMVEFSLFMPAVATAFWIVGGSCLGSAGGRTMDLSRLRWLMAVNAIALTAVAVVVFWRPVHGRTVVTELAMRYRVHQDVEATAHIAYLASLEDPLDGYAAADAARAAAVIASPPDSPEGIAHLQDALQWAQRAMAKDKAYYGHAELAAEIAWRLAGKIDQGGAPVDKALHYMAQAVRLNPMDHRLHLKMAAMYIDAGRAQEGLWAIEEAEETNRALYPESLMRFDAAEQEEIRMLKARAAALLGEPASRPAE
jgi:hypothetical protein